MYWRLFLFHSGISSCINSTGCEFLGGDLLCESLGENNIFAQHVAYRMSCTRSPSAPSAMCQQSWFPNSCCPQQHCCPERRQKCASNPTTWRQRLLLKDWEWLLLKNTHWCYCFESFRLPRSTTYASNNTCNAARPHARMQMLKSLNQAPSAMGDRFQSYRPQQWKHKRISWSRNQTANDIHKRLSQAPHGDKGYC